MLLTLLPLKAQEQIPYESTDDIQPESLQFELVGESLHMTGSMHTKNGTSHYFTYEVRNDTIIIIRNDIGFDSWNPLYEVSCNINAFFNGCTGNDYYILLVYPNWETRYEGWETYSRVKRGYKSICYPYKEAPAENKETQTPIFTLANNKLNITGSLYSDCCGTHTLLYKVTADSVLLLRHAGGDLCDSRGPHEVNIEIPDCTADTYTLHLEPYKSAAWSAIDTVITRQPPRTYIPTYNIGKKWIYTRNEESTDTLVAVESPVFEGYVWLKNIITLYHPEFTNMTDIKDLGNMIVQHYPNNTWGALADSLFRAYATMYSDSDVVMFDYNMQQGDTLNVYTNYYYDTFSTYDSHDFYGYTIRVSSIEELSMQDPPKLKYNLQFKTFNRYFTLQKSDDGTLKLEQDIFNQGYPEKTYWIEGVGYPFWGNSISCVFDNNTNIYSADGADCNGPGSSPNSKIDFNKLTLHKSSDNLIAVFPEAHRGTQLIIYSATGQAVRSLSVREGATTASVPMQGLPKGVYIFSLTSGNGCRPLTAKAVW